MKKSLAVFQAMDDPRKTTDGIHPVFGGMRLPRCGTSWLNELGNLTAEQGLKVYISGDCIAPRNLLTAIHEGPGSAGKFKTFLTPSPSCAI
jgi:hypothetical protein